MTIPAAFNSLRINNAEQFIESASEEANTKLYITIGKVDAWPDENNPNLANGSTASYYECWKNMIGGRRLFSNDLAYVIPRHDWQSGTNYVAYDHMNPILRDGNTIFFIKNSQHSIYKCLSNANSSVSTVEPTAINVTYPISTADGYIWKFMYTLSDVDLLRFTIDNYIPVKTLTADDNSVQWQVQINAVDGAIDYIQVTEAGNNYTNIANVSVVITGDGALATAVPIITANTVSDISITNRGYGYTEATVSIVTEADVLPASARAMIAPPGGHGSDPLYELGGKDVLIDARLKYSEDGVLPTTNDYRQIGLLKDPLINSSNTVSTALAFLQAMTVTCEGSGDYVQDEIIYQGTSLDNAIFSGRVVSWDAEAGKLIVINIKGEPLASHSIIGTTSLTSRVLTSTIPGYLQCHSGRLLYIDNIHPITRASDQIECFKIIMSF